MEEGEIERRSALMKREMGLMYEKVFSEKRKRESRGCRVWHCPSFTTAPVSPVALQHISTQLINAAITQPSPASLKTEATMIHIKCAIGAALRFSLVLVWRQTVRGMWWGDAGTRPGQEVMGCDLRVWRDSIVIDSSSHTRRASAGIDHMTEW